MTSIYKHFLIAILFLLGTSVEMFSQVSPGGVRKSAEDKVPGLQFITYGVSFSNTYDLSGGFPNPTPAHSGYISSLAKIEPLIGRGGTNFGVEVTGFITVPVSGTYSFGSYSDDQTWLSIDGTTVLNIKQYTSSQVTSSI